MRRAVALLVLAFVFVPMLYAPPTLRRTKPPNIVFMFFDDADKSDLMQMPHVMHDVADAGATFDRFYATQSLCCPSRSSFLTGEYVHNHGVGSNGPRTGGFQKFFANGNESGALPVQLQQRGYVTALIGKYLNGYGLYGSASHIPPGWDRWFGAFTQQYQNFDVNDDGVIRRFGLTARDYADNVFNRVGRSWIASTRKQPFFAYLSILAPHIPYTKPPGYSSMFANATPPSFKSPSFNEADVSDKPSYVQKIPRLTTKEIAGVKLRYQHRLQQMKLDDDALGRLVAQLRRERLLDNTYIVVSSDNGWMQGEHRFADKKSVPFEEDVNLPLFIRGPGVKPGVHIGQLASMVDLYPTFLDIAGRRADRDGRSLLPLLLGQPVSWRKQLLLENYSLDEDRVPKFFGVESARFKYVEYRTGDKEFYDLKRDPYELDNEISTVSDKLLSHWQERLHALQTCAGDSCRTADSS